MASEDIGPVYTTQIPGYEDAADIQAALKLYHYATTTVPTDEEDVLPNSIAGHLKALDSRLDDVEGVRTGGDVLDAQPISVPDGFIWLDSESSGGAGAVYSQVVYSNEAPTDNLADGVLWVDKDANPQRAYIYDLGEESWVAITEIPGIFDAAGDLVYGSGADDMEKLSIGIEGQVLSVVNGLPAWSNEKSWVLKDSGSLSGTGFITSGISGEKIFIVLHDWSHDNTENPAMITIRFNNDSGPNYLNTGGILSASSLHSPVFLDNVSHDITISVDLANSASTLKPVSTIADTTDGQYFGYYRNTSSITSVQVGLSPSGNFDIGTYQVWSYE